VSREQKAALLGLEVYPDGRPMYRLDLTSQDFGIWERALGKGRTLKALLEDMQAAWLEELGHLGSKRRGLFDGTLAAFRDQCMVVPVPDADDDPSWESGTAAGAGTADVAAVEDPAAPEYDPGAGPTYPGR
jgi:hypothetical protein